MKPYPPKEQAQALLAETDGVLAPCRAYAQALRAYLQLYQRTSPLLPPECQMEAQQLYRRVRETFQHTGQIAGILEEIQRGIQTMLRAPEPEHEANLLWNGGLDGSAQAERSES